MQPHYVVPSSTSIPFRGIDQGHQQLIDILNRAWDDFSDRKGGKGPTLNRLLSEFRDTLEGHFRQEEKIMWDLEYPQLAKHMSNHTRCATRMDAICHGIDTGTIDLNLKLFDEVYDIVIDDMVRADSGLKAYLYKLNILES